MTNLQINQQNWKVKHPGLALERALAWQKAHPERRKEIQTKWRLNNPIKVKDSASTWQRNNRAKVNACTMRRIAKKQKATPVWAEKDQIEMLYCKAQQYNLEVDHIVPLRNSLVSGLHVWHNLQLLSPKENRQKSNRIWPDMPEDYNSVGGR